MPAVGGEAFFNGDGATTVFFIPHTLGKVPSREYVMAENQVSTASAIWLTKDASYIAIHFTTAPTNGAFLAFAWEARG